MNVYVDKQPQSCWECPCFNPNDEPSCRLADDFDKCYYKGVDEPEDAICPLKTISELLNKNHVEVKNDKQ